MCQLLPVTQTAGVAQRIQACPSVIGKGAVGAVRSASHSVILHSA